MRLRRFIGLIVATQGDAMTITLLQTTDLHTNLLAWDYYTGQTAE